MRHFLVAAAISMAIVLASCSSSKLASKASRQGTVAAPSTSSVPSAPVTTSTSVPATHEGLREAGYRPADSADPTEKNGYFVRPAGIWTTPISDGGTAYELVGVRLDFTADPLATGNSSINADEYSVDNNKIVVNDVVGAFTEATSKICGTYPPIEKAATATGLKENPNATGHSVGIYELKPGTIRFKACLIYQADPGDTFQKVILDESEETNPGLSVGADEGICDT